MTPLPDALANYLTVRRTLGYKLVRAELLLTQFISYLAEQGVQTVTTKLAVAWATLPAGRDPRWWSYRLSVVRGFAGYLQTLDPATEVPPADVLPAGGTRRATPYLYTEEEILGLIAAASTLRFKLRVATYQTLVGLLAVSGMRIGEAIRLNRDDIDFENELLTVHHSKFDRSREIPLHLSTVNALRSYLRQRDQLCPLPRTPAVFVSITGNRLLYPNVFETFRLLKTHAGLHPRSGACRPRIHDLRHTFAVNTLLDAYRSDGEVQPRLALLCTYLGHVNPSNTYWYLSGSPELLALASRRLEHDHGDQL
jgi:integrase